MKVLYVHHSRSSNNEQIYLSSIHREANLALYGAQEMDTWAGIRLLSEFGEVERYEICPNQGFAKHINSKGITHSKIHFSLSASTKFQINSLYLRNLLQNNFDPSVAQWQELQLINHFQTIANDSAYDYIWVDTQFYEPLISAVQKSIIVRSVNFEPRHVLGEDESISRYLKVIPKLLTERKVSKKRTFISISPRDQKSYSRLGIRSHLIPLRQLGYCNESLLTGISSPDTVFFTGSTYDVLHNRKNLYFILEELAPILLKSYPDIKIAITGNRLPANVRLPKNVQYLGFLPDLQERLIGALAVLVPYFGGAGMQSKVFEALTIGSKVIANPNVMAGYPFLPERDFVPAITAQQFLEAIKRLRIEKEFGQMLAFNGKHLANELFSHNKVQSQIGFILNNIKES